MMPFLRASVRAVAIASLILASGRANAQSGGGIFCLPTNPYCFDARWVFSSDPINPGYSNRLVVDITNLDGRLDADPSSVFGFLGFLFIVGPNVQPSPDGPFVIARLYDPTPIGLVNVNPAPAGGVNHDDPGGWGDGYSYFQGDFGLEGCTTGPGPNDWSYSTCPATDHGGFLRWNIDLAYRESPQGPTHAATFEDFDLTAVTTAGACDLTPSDWRPSDYRCLESASVTPEPGTLALLFAPMVGLGVGMWRTTRSARSKSGAA